jgi:hypothetical protein
MSHVEAVNSATILYTKGWWWFIVSLFMNYGKVCLYGKAARRNIGMNTHILDKPATTVNKKDWPVP